MRFDGIFPPVITPYNDDFSIDRAGFVTIVDYLVKAGVNGIIVGGTTGEYYAQTREERIELIGLARDTIKQRLPLIVGVGAIRTEDCVDYAQIAAKSGADAILMSAPFYALPTQLELAKHALEVDRAANLPIMLYNYPGRTGTSMSKEFFDQVAQNPNFAAVKESTGDINQMHMLANDYPNISLLCGMDDQALEFFAWGARGWVCAGANCLPQAHIALYEAVALNNDIAKGREIMKALFPFLAILEQGGKLIQVVKYVCALRGLPSGRVRKPLGELNEQEKQAVEKVLETLDATMAGLENQAEKEDRESVVAVNA